ncbi:InvB/SpaK family type III secretion system chaperone [Paludibacterium paludis]|uniref:Invasion protein B family protein n=1 Tax=Paludibacterium paludis TaxID=1225769 RepID=A0A918UBH8_9NEIS|nr:SPI-1 type III secretion system chaperone SpaK [Paludibacterium paludis]GGY24008.1 hypothetical protein GCM10011289_29670 [Paludibacterium paludis]
MYSHNLDIARLVRDALTESGCSESLIGDLDGHSTIALDFKDIPSLFVTANEDGIWIWSRIAEYNPAAIDNRAAAILQHLMSGSAFMVAGHPVLTVGEGYLEYKALVKEEWLSDSQRFSEVLNGFFERIEAMDEIVNR